MSSWTYLYYHTYIPLSMVIRKVLQIFLLHILLMPHPKALSKSFPKEPLAFLTNTFYPDETLWKYESLLHFPARYRLDTPAKDAVRHVQLYFCKRQTQTQDFPSYRIDGHIMFQESPSVFHPLSPTYLLFCPYLPQR